MERGFNSLHELIDRLKAEKIHFTLATHRDDSIMVQVAIPGERWEIEFFKSGEIEVEKFKSDGTISNASALSELFEAS